MALGGHLQLGPPGLRLEDGFGRTPLMGASWVEAGRWFLEDTSDWASWVDARRWLLEDTSDGGLLG